MANLAQQVYDDWLNGSITSYTMPAGTWTLPGAQKLQRRHPDFDCDFTGCTLEANPDNTGAWGNTFEPIQVISVPNNPIWDESSGGTDRKVSGLTGTVTAGTTQLTMIPSELILDLVAGEEVMLQIGVDVDDPVEPYAYVAAVIQSVNTDTGVITFAEALDVEPPVYTEAQLIALTEPNDLDWKVGEWGTWPSDANFSKGFGEHHGMERYANGRLTTNVQLRNITFNLTSNLTVGTIPNGIWPFSAIAVRDLLIDGMTLNNPVGNMLHLWKCFDVQTNDIVVTGQGISKPGGGTLAEAYVFTAWGGARHTHTNVSVSGNDIALFNMEVNTGEITLYGLDFNVVFTSTRTYSSSPVIFGFFSVIDTPRVHNAIVRASTTGGSAHAYDGFTPVAYTGYLKFPGTSLTGTLDFDYLKNPDYSGIVNVVIGGKGYGPQQSISATVPLVDNGAYADVAINGLVLETARFRITTKGDLRDITDSYGNNYWGASGGAGAGPYDWVTLQASHWHQIASGSTALTNYRNKYIRFWFTGGGTSNAEIEIQYTYLPIRIQKKYCAA